MEVNGIIVKIQKMNEGAYIAFSEDLADWDAGDELQLYVKVTSGYTGKVQNFRVCGNHASSTVEITGTNS